MPREDQDNLAQTLQVNLVQTPSKYLSLNFKVRGKRVANFQVLVNRLQSKLQGWNAKLLSQVGRTTLISSILQAMSLYTFSCMRVPKTICNKMDAITKAFWWGHDLGVRKLHIINWDTICRPTKRGRSWA